MSEAASDRFIGRARELDLLVAGVDGARTGSTAAAFVITGPGGIGKTRLLLEAARHARDRSMAVHWGRAWGGAGTPPYWPWVQVIRSIARQADVSALLADVGDSRRYLSHVAPELEPEAGPPPSGLDTEHGRFHLFDAVVRFLQAAARSPMVLAFDDLHEADPETWLLLEFVAARLQDVPVAVLGGTRSSSGEAHVVGEMLERLERSARRIELGGLDVSATRSLAQAIVGAPVDGELAERLHAETGGNPYLVGELASWATEPSLAGRTARPWPAVASPRLIGLDDATRATLHAAAILGREFSLTTLAAVLDDGREAIFRRLQPAITSGVVTTMSATLGRYRFDHDLVREAVERELSTGDRRRLHRQTAAALERLYGGDAHDHAAEIARHHVAGADAATRPLAARWCERAGDRAAGVLAYDAAVGHYRDALDLLDATGPDDARRCSLLLRLGAAQVRGRGSADARVTFDSAAALASRLGDGGLLADAAIGSCRAVMRGPGLAGTLPEAIPLLRQALVALDDGPEQAPRRATILSLLTEIESTAGTGTGAREAAEAAAETSSASTDPGVHVAAAVARRWALSGGPDLAAAEAATAELERLARRHHDLELEWVAQRWRLLDGLERGDPDRARRAAAASSSIADTLGEPYVATLSTIWHGTIAMYEGRFADVDRLTARAVAEMDDAQVGSEAVAGQRLYLGRERGALDATVVDWMASAGPQHIPVRVLAAWAFANLGDAAAAGAVLDRLMAARTLDAAPPGFHLASVAMLAEACARIPAAEHADAILAALDPYADSCVVTWGGAPVVWTGHVGWYRGRLLSLLGRYDEADRALRASLATHVRMRAAPFVARSQAALAENLGRRRGAGDLAEARALVDAASAEATRLGMPALAQEVDGIRSAISGGPTEAAPTALAGPVQMRREGTHWLLTRQAVSFSVRDSKGIAQLRELLARPDVELHSLDLIAGRDGTPAHRRATAAAEADHVGPQAGLAVLDATARDAYRLRYQELVVEADEAEAWNDTERAARCREELEALARELSRAIGLGGRERTTGSAVERARVNVTRTIRKAIADIAAADPVLGHHLATSVETGVYCAYRPHQPLSWEL